MPRIIEIVIILIALSIYFPVAFYLVFKKSKTKEGVNYEKSKRKK